MTFSPSPSQGVHLNTTFKVGDHLPSPHTPGRRGEKTFFLVSFRVYQFSLPFLVKFSQKKFSQRKIEKNKSTSIK